MDFSTKGETAPSTRVVRYCRRKGDDSNTVIGHLLLKPLPRETREIFHEVWGIG